MNLFDHLDEDQRKAVSAPDGFVRVIAGAGTGKTTTLKSRIQWLIENKKALPNEIVAVTFTNKAAKEIRDRVTSAVGPLGDQVRMGTFHSLSVRFLRKYYSLVGLQSARFTIVDDSEVGQLMQYALDASSAFGECSIPERPVNMDDKQYDSMVKNAQKDFELEKKHFLKEAKSQIMRWKECGLSLQEALESHENQLDPQKSAMVQLYAAYQDELERRNSVDFADLILKVVQIFDDRPDILEYESKRIKYLLVDEFQDTNMIQFKWVSHLTSYHGNLFVVGDVDQSLYSFRGSAPEIMYRLTGGHVQDVVLKTNRRCTQEILAPANMLVDINKREAPKELISERSGEKVLLSVAQNEHSEASLIANKIDELIKKGTNPSEIAVLARASHVLSNIEKSLVRKGIRYSLVGGRSIMEREEIKDVLAYLKLAVNPYNDLAFRRIANKPVRGLGPAAVDFVCSIADMNSCNYHEACILAAGSSGNNRIKKEAKNSLGELGGLLSSIQAAYNYGVPSRSLVHTVYTESGYAEWLKNEKDDFIKRDKNVGFLADFASDFDDLADFLQEASLLSDEIDADDGVRLGTIHSSKGLEFDHVFLPAWEEGILPSKMSLEEIPGDLDNPWIGPSIGGCEEERRIAHVAITRARQSVSIYYAKVRNNQYSKPSRFIREAELKPSKSFQSEPNSSFSGNRSYGGKTRKSSGEVECSPIVFKW